MRIVPDPKSTNTRRLCLFESQSRTRALEDCRKLSEDHPYLVTALVWASWTAIMLPRMVVTALLPTFESTYHITHAQSGLLMTSYFYAYTLMQIPAGFLCDRFGRKRFIVASLIGSSLASLALWRAQSFEQMILLRAIAGFFAGLWYAPSISLLTSSVRDQDRGKAMGIALSGPSVSDVTIFMMVGTLGVDGFGWRNYFVIYAIPGFVCALVIWFMIKKVTEKQGVPNRSISRRTEVREVLRNRVVLSILICAMAISIAQYSFRTFLPTYFVQSRGLTSSEASLLMVSYAASVILSSPLGGYLIDRVGCNLPSIITLITMYIVTLTLPVIPLGIPVVAVLLAWGLMGGWSVTAFSVLLTRLVPPQTRGAFLGILNSCTFFGAATGPLILGYAADIGGFSAFFASALVVFILASLAIIPVLKSQRRATGWT